MRFGCAPRRGRRSPDDLTFKTKLELALDLVDRALDDELPGEILLATTAAELPSPAWSSARTSVARPFDASPGETEHAGNSSRTSAFAASKSHMTMAHWPRTATRYGSLGVARWRDAADEVRSPASKIRRGPQATEGAPLLRRGVPTSSRNQKASSTGTVTPTAPATAAPSAPTPTPAPPAVVVVPPTHLA